MEVMIRNLAPIWDVTKVWVERKPITDVSTSVTADFTFRDADQK